MKDALKKRLNDFPMKWLMIGFTVLGFVLVPGLWNMGYRAVAIAVMLVVLTMLVQAACIDLPGSPYRRLHRLWNAKRNKNDD